MEAENNSDHEKEHKKGIKEEPFCMETTQYQIKSVLANVALQKETVDISSCSLMESELDTHLKRESKIDIKEEPWCMESISSIPAFESEEIPSSNNSLENGLVYVSCDSVTDPENKKELDRVIKEEPLWKFRLTESKDGGDLQDDMKDTDSTVNERSPKLSTETQRSCTETVSNCGTSTSNLSASADLQENSCLKMKEVHADCKTSDFAVQLKKNSSMQGNNEVHAKVEIKEETWWLDRTSPVKPKPESTLLIDADVPSNTKQTLSQLKKCWGNTKTKWTRDMANEKKQVMKTGGGPPSPTASIIPKLEVAVPRVGHNAGFWLDSAADAIRSPSDLSEPALVIMLGSEAAVNAQDSLSTPAAHENIPADFSSQDQLCTDVCSGMDAPVTVQEGLLLLPQPPLSLPRKCTTRESLVEEELEMRLKRHRLQVESNAKLQSFREKDVQLLVEDARERREITRREEERRRQAFHWEKERKRKAFKWEEERKRKAFEWEEDRKRKALKAEERRKEEKHLLELKIRKKQMC